MPLYDYTGQLASGALFQGTIEAAEQPAAETTLAQLGVRVTTLRPARRAAFVAPLSLGDVAFFNDQLAALTKAGLPLEQGLRQLASDVGSRKLKRLLLDLADDLAAGTPLPQALEREKGRFPPQYAAVVAAGLKTGDLSGTLYGLTTHLRLKSGFRRAVLEAVAYPLVVLTFAFLVASFLMRMVVPMLAGLFSDLARVSVDWYGYHRPFPPFGGWGPPDNGGAFLFTLARAWPAIEIACGAFVALLIGLFLITLLPGMRTFRERLLRYVPGVAQVYWSSVLARFAHTSALAAYTGTPLPELVAASGEASGSPALTRTTAQVGEKLALGADLDQAVAGERDVPALWTCAVQVAAPRGDLPGALAELARMYEARAQRYANVVRTTIGASLFLLMALTIGALIASIFSVFGMFTEFLFGLL